MLSQIGSLSAGQTAADIDRQSHTALAPAAEGVAILDSAGRLDEGRQQDKVFAESADTIIDEISGGFDVGFFKDEKTGKMVIRIIDRKSGEVRKQIPPDQILALMYRLQELQGLVLDQIA